MTLRTGYVVATHAEDHSFDLVMLDNGERLVGVQLMSQSASTRTGTVDLPAVPEKADKWDIKQETGQDMKALVGYVGRNPVVLGFLPPQINQMTLSDPKTRLSRHQSDVISLIDGDGNMQLTHPSGAYVRMGETPDVVDLAGKNFDKNLKVDRNTDRKLFVRVSVPGAFTLTMTPQGQLTLDVQQGAAIQFGAEVGIKAPKITLDTPLVEVPSGDVVASGVSLTGHRHEDVRSGSDISGPPQR